MQIRKALNSPIERLSRVFMHFFNLIWKNLKYTKTKFKRCWMNNILFVRAALLL